MPIPARPGARAKTGMVLSAAAARPPFGRHTAAQPELAGSQTESITPLANVDYHARSVPVRCGEEPPLITTNDRQTVPTAAAAAAAGRQ